MLTRVFAETYVQTHWAIEKCLSLFIFNIQKGLLYRTQISNFAVVKSRNAIFMPSPLTPKQAATVSIIENEVGKVGSVGHVSASGYDMELFPDHFAES